MTIKGFLMNALPQPSVCLALLLAAARGDGQEAGANGFCPSGHTWGWELENHTRLPG